MLNTVASRDYEILSTFNKFNMTEEQATETLRQEVCVCSVNMHISLSGFYCTPVCSNILVQVNKPRF